MTSFEAGRTDPVPSGRSPGFRGWRMVFSGFLFQNVPNGFLYGTFGVAMLAAQDRFDSSRATIALGMSLALLTMSLVSPFISRIMNLLSLRGTVLCGLTLSCAGYLVLAVAPSSLVYLLAYGLLIGAGSAMSGSLTASILASNWFVARQGTAVGIVNVPLFNTLAPLAAIWVLDQYSLTILYLCLAAGHLLAFPAALSIVDRPEMIGQRALGAEDASPTAVSAQEMSATAPEPLLRRGAFWVMVAGGGTLNAVSIIAISHIVALSVERGLTPVAASSLVSVLAGSAIAGALLIGALCDRVGPALSLAIAAAGLAAAWFCVLMTTWLPALLVAVAMHGLFVGGVFPATSLLARRLFGGEAMARAIGLFFPLTLPITFFAPPVAGWLRDVSGSYQGVLVFMVASSSAVALAFLVMWQLKRGDRHGETAISS